MCSIFIYIGTIHCELLTSVNIKLANLQSIKPHCDDSIVQYGGSHTHSEYTCMYIS